MRAKPEHFGKIHLVFDVENLSCQTDGHVLSFACVAFHSDEGWMEAFQVAIPQKRGMRTGHVDPSTVAWWIEQAMQNPSAAMDTFGITAEFECDPRASFHDFLYSEVGIKATPAEFTHYGVTVWGHAPRVDIIQLEHALYGGERLAPWDFRLEADTRTLMTTWGRMRPDEVGLWELADQQAERRTSLSSHSALRDAYRQAFMVIIFHNWLDRFSGDDE